MTTVTLNASAEPGNWPPRVRIDITASGTPTVTSVVLSRTDPDGRNRPVRTADGGALPLSGGVATIFDYEPPYGSAVTYWVNVSGAPTDTVTLDVAVPWLVHPGIPSRSVPLDLRKGSNASEDWNVDQGSFVILGRSTPVVVTGGARSAPASTLIAATHTRAEFLAMRLLLSDGSPLLLNVSPSLAIGLDSAYVAIGNVQPARLSDVGTDPNWDFPLPYQVVDRPAGGTQAAITWLDVAAQYASFNAIVAAGVDSWAELAAPTT